jgi:DNA-binding NtrC family response regulator
MPHTFPQVRPLTVPQILVVNNDPDVRDRLRASLVREGFATLQAGDGRSALHLLREKDVSLLLLDLELPGISGMEVLEHAAEHRPDLPVIVVNGTGSIPTAVRTVRLGALDFLEKPVDDARTLETVRIALERAAHRRREVRDRAETLERYGMVGRSGAMRTVFEIIDGAASVDLPVVMTGESGTGKETLARAIHRNGPRAELPFVPVDCAAIPASRPEDELFGQLEQAHGGSLFMDEVAELSSAAQATLLRVLEAEAIERVGPERSVPVDVRFLAATNRDLTEDVAVGTFREDLYDRLNVISIPVPPLRTRPEDIPELLEHFLDLGARAGARPRVSTAALSMLLYHEWPGNARDVRDTVDRMLLFAAGDEITGDIASRAIRRHEPDPEPLLRI